MLQQFQDTLAQNLSGGMKRKLSLAMALVSKPQLIILDEPTSGLDSESRKQVLSIIKEMKKDRSIIFATQHLDEAEAISDKVLVMQQGKLTAFDTPQKIKQQYGIGYKVIVTPVKEAEQLIEEE